MKRQEGLEIRVFVVWEKVRFTDFGAPSSFTLKRISDSRASQYWDKSRLVSHLIGEGKTSSIVWDYVAIYPKGGLWDQSPPEPVYSHAPVIQGVGGVEAALKAL